MEEKISSVEAARALQNVAVTKARMHGVIRAHRGHYQLWLWGVILSGECLATGFFGVQALRWPSMLAGAVGIFLSFAIGFWQSRRIRSQIDRRFVAVVIMTVVFELVLMPQLTGFPHDPKTGYTYNILIVTQTYILAGIWFDSFLLWSGILMGIFALVGLWGFPEIYWWWSAFFIGGTLIGTGFYVRYFRN